MIAGTAKPSTAIAAHHLGGNEDLVLAVKRDFGHAEISGS
jgi:hypothetical protein